MQSLKGPVLIFNSRDIHKTRQNVHFPSAFLIMMVVTVGQTSTYEVWHCC